MYEGAGLWQDVCDKCLTNAVRILNRDAPLSADEAAAVRHLVAAAAAVDVVDARHQARSQGRIPDSALLARLSREAPQLL